MFIHYSPVDPDQPVFGGVSLLQVGQLEVLVANDSITSAVKAGRSSEVKLKK